MIKSKNKNMIDYDFYTNKNFLSILKKKIKIFNKFKANLKYIFNYGKTKLSFYFFQIKFLILFLILKDFYASKNWNFSTLFSCFLEFYLCRISLF
jgi:hypothetical protein